MKRWGILVVVLGLVAPASADAVVLRYSDGSTPTVMQSWADQMRVPTVPGAVEIRLESCPGQEEPACTSPDAPLFFDWLRLGDRRATLYHELGHHFDYAMPDATRVSFGEIMGDQRLWRDVGGNAPVEQFAEAYARCAFGIQARRMWWAFNYRPTRAQNRAVCALIRSL